MSRWLVSALLRRLKDVENIHSTEEGSEVPRLRSEVSFRKCHLVASCMPTETETRGDKDLTMER